MALDPRHSRRDLAGIGRGRAGDAGDRHVIDEARRVVQHRRQTLVVGRRRGEADEVEPRLQRRQAQLLIFLRRQIDDDEAVDTGRLGIGQELVDAVDIDRIVIAHQHDRRVVVIFAEGAYQIERLGHALAAFERAHAGGLNRRAVGHRIGERHADLDHVGAGLRQRLHDRDRGVIIRIAGHGESHQRGALLRLQRGEAFFDTGRHLDLRKIIRAVCRSSPSPP